MWAGVKITSSPVVIHILVISRTLGISGRSLHSGQVWRLTARSHQTALASSLAAAPNRLPKK